MDDTTFASIGRLAVDDHTRSLAVTGGRLTPEQVEDLPVGGLGWLAERLDLAHELDDEGGIVLTPRILCSELSTQLDL